jgi:membrane AbrB-like protein
MAQLAIFSNTYPSKREPLSRSKADGRNKANSQFLLHLVGACGGAIAFILQMPLPWIVGSMIGAGVGVVIFGLDSARPIARIAGQLIIGAAIGLAVTGQAVTMIMKDLPIAVIAALFTVAISVLVALAQRRYARLDIPTAVLSSIPGGPVEMSEFAKRYGGDYRRVALTQTLRVLTLVLVFPTALALAGRHRVKPQERFVRFGATALYASAVIDCGASRR